jgi:ferric iron reductase protein FhuF
METSHSKVVNDLKEQPELTDEIREALKSAIKEFVKTIKKEESAPVETSS